ncbi:hypothetical protein CAEBREN_21345 [Caenorhabditis brenneri]|uniref:Uncharacterized protein n=1 Tax=Caenorhabditis brenneri TaxID=135651 RepID=G0MCN3_CAEBE|nr:hypothetical protein CAEBREN_21345 [Caenorhabditis brenneri]
MSESLKCKFFLENLQFYKLLQTQKMVYTDVGTSRNTWLRTLFQQSSLAQYIRLELVENGTIVYPAIRCNNKPELYIHYYFNVLGKDGQSFFRFLNNCKLYKTYGPRGYDMKILDILNQKNGYLVNGTLSIEYGIHINGIMGDYRIWKFNFINKLFDPDHSQTVEYWDPTNRRLKFLYCHKQVHFLVSRTFCENNACFNYLKFERSLPMFLFKNSMEFGLRHHLAHLVNRFECLEDLKNVIQKLDIEKMSGETMKTFMVKIFKLNT